MLSPTTDHGALAQNGAEERGEERESDKSPSAEQLPTQMQRGKGKKRPTSEDSSNFELPAMLKEMNKEIKEMD